MSRYNDGKLRPIKGLRGARFSRAEIQRFVTATYAEEKANQFINQLNILDR